MSNESILQADTLNWTSLTVARVYQNSEEGRQRLTLEASALGSHGYTPSTSSSDDGHINLGRTLGGAALTGGLTLLFGGSRTGGAIVVTFTRAPAGSVADRVDEIVRTSSAAGYIDGYRTPIGSPTARIRAFGVRGFVTMTLWADVDIANPSTEAISASKWQIYFGAHPLAIDTFGVVGVGAADAWGATLTHHGGKLIAWEQEDGELPAETTRTVHWERVGVPEGQRVSISVVPKAVRKGDSWEEYAAVPISEAAVSQASGEYQAKEMNDLAGTKVCPDCAERVREEARICRYCRHEFWPLPNGPDGQLPA